MAVHISRSALEAIIAQTALHSSVEICGLLLGEGAYIATFQPADNVAADPMAHFEIDPAMLIASLRAARHGGPSLLGYLHSHPNGSTAPSPTDARAAEPDGMLWLIVAGDRVAAWRSGQGGLHGRFTPEPLTVVDDAALASLGRARQ